MADSDKEINRFDTDGDVISDLEALSKKYGLPFGAEKYKTPYNQEDFSPLYAPDVKKVISTPKNNNPARTPRVIYDTSAKYPSVRLVYDEYENAPKGPEGRRTIYKESETESIAAKRLRNAREAAMNKNGGFAQNPYTRQVAGSQPSDDMFTSAYLSGRQNTKNTQNTENTESGKYFENARTSTKSDGSVPVYKTARQTEQAGKASALDKKPISHRHYELTAKDHIRNFFKAFLPWKGDSAKEVIRKIVMDVSAILVLICFGFFVDNYIQHQNELEKQRELQSLQNEDTESDLEKRWAEIKAKYPNVDFPDGMNIKWAELYAANQDFVGKLTIHNTKYNTSIDTPVVQSQNDAYQKENGEDYYLHHSFYKKYSKYGTAYMDVYNTGSELDRNNVIYSHNMTDGLGFAQLERYYEIDGFKEAPIIQYSTLFHDYYFKVYAVIITNGYPSADNGYLFNYVATSFSSDESFQKFIEALDERKLYDTGVDANKNDKFITLSTCSYEIKATNMGRLAVIGRLVRNGESTAVDTSKAKENTNVRYPQIWYDEHNMTNPFADAYRWQP